MIPRELTAEFPPDVRARGEQYFAQRRVRITSATARAIVAVVSGTQDYVVQLAATSGECTLDCSCPYAADNGVCKHIWATVRQADADGALARLITTHGPRIVYVTSEDIDDEDLDDLDDTDFPDLKDDWKTHHWPASTRARGVAPNDKGISNKPRPKPVPHKPPPAWKRTLDAVANQMRYRADSRPGPATWPDDRRLVYIVDLDATRHADGIVVDVGTEKRLSDDVWAPPKRFSLGAPVWFAAPDPVDQQIGQMLRGAVPAATYAGVRVHGFVLRGLAIETTLRPICETGRCRMRHGNDHEPVSWDDGPPWEFRMRVVHEPTPALVGVLRRSDAEMPLSEPLLVHRAGFLVMHGSIARFDHRGAEALAWAFRENPALPLDDTPLAEVLQAFCALPRFPALELPDGAPVTESRAEPVPCVSIGPDPEPWRARGPSSSLTLSFSYGNARAEWNAGGETIFDRETLTIHVRRLDVESARRERIFALGARREWNYGQGQERLIVPAKKLPALVRTLLQDGWRVEADGLAYREPGAMRAAVRSGIDWFDLDAAVRYGDTDVPLSVLLEASRRGESTIALADGTLGILPEEWLQRLGAVAAGGESNSGSKRFRRSQLALLDALLAVLPEVTVDETFEKARAELGTFDRIVPADPPRSFTGTLRGYQRDGLGWLHFLRRFQLGGCLADDMGLGKTVQVLALLAARRAERGKAGPSIIVVPRSLVFNWLREAERFTPKLRVLDYSRGDRKYEVLSDASADIVITTYGMIRRDAPVLAGFEFDYAILDEATAIKNAGTATAKACRLLQARHRLALTGTPVENRLEELWSLLEFLNPGMLGAASRFAALARMPRTPAAALPGGKAPEPSAPPNDGRALLARALRPVILRRTKEQVAPELPKRLEQTIEVELEPPQRKFYDSLREGYRRSVLERVDRSGIRGSRMHILEALLRLRQAACHPALANPRKSALPSAKLDALVPALQEVVAGRHKALVFSQFTTFLGIVRRALDDAGMRYEYLDGKTRDRQARVDRFQTDATCPVFLISLKAGGHGLNLTAADYVYILDPWWNPAVEAQAIDRAHRIGQTRRVIATRLVARDTIEGKILELQSSKRDLADAILAADQGMLAAIGRAELELLLS